MNWIFYRDIFGGWRWEFMDTEGNTRDSQHSYGSREDCVEAAKRGGMNAPLVSNKRSVLCVQPDEKFHQGLELALTDYRTVFVRTAVDAMRNINSCAFDAYVLDYWVPGWSGIHVCREIRRIDPHAPIAFYTAAGSEDQRTRAFKAGASTYVCVAAGDEVLCEELRALIERADAASAAAQANEYRAIQEELKRRVVVPISQSERVREVAAEATEKAVRAKAFAAYIESGGTRANFERDWPQAFREGALAAAASLPDSSTG
jgi:DNA-binding response OmpR family regulator